MLKRLLFPLVVVFVFGIMSHKAMGVSREKIQTTVNKQIDSWNMAEKYLSGTYVGILDVCKNIKEKNLRIQCKEVAWDTYRLGLIYIEQRVSCEISNFEGKWRKKWPDWVLKQLWSAERKRLDKRKSFEKAMKKMFTEERGSL